MDRPGKIGPESRTLCLEEAPGCNRIDTNFTSANLNSVKFDVIKGEAMAGTSSRRAILPLLLAIFSSAVLTGCGEMGGQVLFSEIHGVLLDDGKPVSNTRLNRKWHWQNNDLRGVDTATTDPAGRFDFPAITGRSLLMAILPLEKLIRQSIAVVGAEGEQPIWEGVKRNYRSGGEIDLFNEQPPGVLYVRCDLQGRNRTNGSIAGPCEFVSRAALGL